MDEEDLICFSAPSTPQPSKPALESLESPLEPIFDKDITQLALPTTPLSMLSEVPDQLLEAPTPAEDFTAETKTADSVEVKLPDENVLSGFPASAVVASYIKSPIQVEIKTQDDAAFSSFLKNQVLEENNEKSAKKLNPHSAAWLVKQSVKRIIESPREYQIDLFEKAKDQNTIIVLDTGCGKTLIAILLLRYTIEQEQERVAKGLKRRTAFFLVEKVPLVHQQYHVIESNLSYPAARVWGRGTDEIWDKSQWANFLSDNAIIVCTAAILQKALASTYVRMSDINLLIFDEAHHAKKNHPYARIMKDFYFDEPEASRPRILGMTASPVESLEDVRYAAMNLENLLCSRIATVNRGTFHDDLLSRKQVQIKVEYSPLSPPFQTKFVKSIAHILQRNEDLRKLLNFSEVCASTLGPWCATRFWKIFFSKAEILRLTARSSQRESAETSLHADGSLTSGISTVARAIEELELPPLTRDSQCLSSKVIALLGILNELFQSGTGHRCIVFVDQRYTALVLADLVEQSAIFNPHLKAQVLLGVSGNSQLLTFRQQSLTIHRFRKGELNCLFATSVAEEGLDIPDCDVIIRFDLYKTMIQYIQSKGRARHKHARYYTLMEQANVDHIRRVAFATRDAVLLRRFCAQLPEDRVMEDASETLKSYSAEHAHTCYVIPSSGAKLGWMQSFNILAKFVSHLATEEERQRDLVSKIDYMIIPTHGGYYCQINLPSASPITCHRGSQQPSRAAAKCAAAFEVCVNLINQGFIDEYLEPTFKRKLKLMRVAKLGFNCETTNEYDMRVKPKFWRDIDIPDLGSYPLYGVAISLTDADVLPRQPSPLILLSRKQMPELLPIKLFFENNAVSAARITRIPGAISSSKIPELKHFTLRIFRDVFSKDFASEGCDLPYFIAPSVLSNNFNLGNLNLERVINWSVIQQTRDHDYLELGNNDPHEFYQGKFCIDPFDGGRKLYLLQVRDDLRPTDPVPEGVAEPKFRGWKRSKQDIMAYSCSLWGSNRGKYVWKEDQAVLEAEQMSLRRNLLDRASGDNDTRKTNRTCFVIMEPMRVSTIPASTVAMACTFPAIIYRIEETLIALELTDRLGLSIRPEFALTAITKDGSSADSSGVDEIRINGGAGGNYERLEFLGDAFLKMASTIALYINNSSSAEGEYHCERVGMVSNSNMYRNATKFGLQEYIRTQKFDRRAWYPEGLVLRKGKSSKVKNVHSLGNKSIADVCEALIGAAFVSPESACLGPATSAKTFDEAVKGVTVMVQNELHTMTRWEDYSRNYKIPGWAKNPPKAAHAELAEIVAKTTGYRFKHVGLMLSAFKHPSYPFMEGIPNYQNLEFLGDALLDMAIIDYLYKTFPDGDPQWLTEHKMAMASNRFLGCLSVELGFNRAMFTANPNILGSILDYVQQIESARWAAEEAAKKTGEKVNKSYWAGESIKPPKCLPDILEAYVGAMFLDSGLDYGVVHQFFVNHVKPYFEDMGLYDSYANRHPVTYLVKKVQGEFRCIRWSMVTREKPLGLEAGAELLKTSCVAAGFVIHGQVVGVGEEEEVRFAKVQAALQVTEKISRMSLEDYRVEFGCDCGDGRGK
ncbi:hypothetical protein TD95_004288 [Thielaviopsis punctulata]|uniref:Dicer-like protein 1 n=1 Tax=Thielaviopsis punctulata TaxID=72032 RepID=A0A0F4ZDF0_9PEZI|nr:hypothetical protein TD95_004288 [Thielaviopsis punctulata]